MESIVDDCLPGSRVMGLMMLISVEGYGVKGSTGCYHTRTHEVVNLLASPPPPPPPPPKKEMGHLMGRGGESYDREHLKTLIKLLFCLHVCTYMEFSIATMQYCVCGCVVVVEGGGGGGGG